MKLWKVSKIMIWEVVNYTQMNPLGFSNHWPSSLRKKWLHPLKSQWCPYFHISLFLSMESWTSPYQMVLIEDKHTYLEHFCAPCRQLQNIQTLFHRYLMYLLPIMHRIPPINAQCWSIPINADQNSGIDLTYLSILVNADQCRPKRIDRKLGMASKVQCLKNVNRWCLGEGGSRPEVQLFKGFGRHWFFFAFHLHKSYFSYK